MRVISKKKIREFSLDNPQAKLPLVEWYRKMLVTDTRHFSELRKLFNSADYVSGYTVFNIGGNNYRLIAMIHYDRQCCYIRAIMTHAEYSKSINQVKLVKRTL